MEIVLLVFALTMAAVAAGTVVACVVSEASEAWDITRHGWVHGHHRHLLHRS